jgi:hypothetical protein
MITYYHRHASEKRFGPGERLARELYCPVLHIDVFLGNERIGPKCRLTHEELERTRVRLGVNFERSKDLVKPEPDAWAFVSIRALRHEVRAVWRALNESCETGELKVVAMPELSRKQLAELEVELRQLEVEDPTVAAAAKKLDDFMAEARAEFRRRAFELVERELRSLKLMVCQEAGPGYYPVWDGEEQDGWSLIAAIAALKEQP